MFSSKGQNDLSTKTNSDDVQSYMHPRALNLVASFMLTGIGISGLFCAYAICAGVQPSLELLLLKCWLPGAAVGALVGVPATGFIFGIAPPWASTWRRKR